MFKYIYNLNPNQVEKLVKLSKMKKLLLCVAFWAILLTQANSQNWEQMVPSGSFSGISSAIYSPTYGYLFGGSGGIIYRVQNQIIDTIYNGGLLGSSKVLSMTFSQDTLFFSTGNLAANSSWKMKIGEPAQLGSYIFKSMIARANKRWLSTSTGLVYYDGVTYTHNNAFNSSISAMDVDNSEIAYIAQNDSLLKVDNLQYSLICDTIPGIKCIKINPLTNELYFSTETNVYKKVGNTITSITLSNDYADYLSFGYLINFFSFSAEENRIFIFTHSMPGSTVLLTNNGTGGYKSMNIPKNGNTGALLAVPVFEAENQLVFTSMNSYYRTTTDFYSNDGNLENQVFLDKGAFKALINSNGTLFNDVNTMTPCFLNPKESGKNTIFTGTLWLGGINQNNDTCVAGQRFNQVGYDFWAGPVSEVYDANYDHKYNKVWRINRAEIENHIANSQASGYNTPPAILAWPAHGNVANGEAAFIAPFFDANGDGQYHSQDGDYPIVYGQQAAYFIYNDSRYAHTETGGMPLGVEIHGMAYVMDSTNLDLKNTMFLKYNVFNRQNNDFHDFYLSHFDDLDIGNANDDFIGCDSARRAYYAYNGCPIDGHGLAREYGALPPAQGITFLNNDMHQFVYFNNVGGNPHMADPNTAKEYYSYMQGFWNDGLPYTFGGDGYGTGTPTKYVFSGNPLLSDTTQWTEINMHNAPSDRRGLGSINMNSFNQGTNHCFDLAYVYDQDCTDTLTCNNLSNIAGMLNRIDSVRSYFNNHELSCNMNNIVFKANTIPDFNSCQHVEAFANNAQINYFQTIDSVQITEIVGVTPTTVKASWKIFQNGNIITLSNVPFNVQDNVPVVLNLNLMHNPNTHSMVSYTIEYFVHGLVGINEISDVQISIQPNPTTGKIYVTGIEHAQLIELFDIQGRKLLQVNKQNTQPSVEINLSEYKKGIYFVKISSNNGKQITKKLILN